MTRATIASNLKTALPCILIGGMLGAMAGVVFDSTAIGARIGIIVGGIVAFLILRLR